jgi:hypothetical protein
MDAEDTAAEMFFQVLASCSDLETLQAHALLD